MDEKDLFYKGLKDLALRCLEEGRPLAYLLFAKQVCRNEAEEKYARQAFKAALGQVAIFVGFSSAAQSGPMSR
jgi:hypothetical protein